MLNFLRKQIITIFSFIILVEIILQISFRLDLKYVNHPILFYNGYCDQEYWYLNKKKIKFDSDIVYHPILSYKKKIMNIPNELNDKQLVKKTDFIKNNISLYGSSFIDHKKFKLLIEKNDKIKFKNYALNSYGLDQIFLSYKLTSHLNQNQIIVFGFLLEDLDRSIFSKRDYNKPKFNYTNGNFELTNIPVNKEIDNNKKYDFYLFKFLSNFFNLLSYDFDPRLSTCSIISKKNLFNYFFNNIQSEAKKFNQEIIVITFNLKEDILKNKSWRYNFVKNQLMQRNIIHIDSLELLKADSNKYNERIEDYYSKDLHNSKKGFERILNEFYSVYNAI